MAIKFLAVACLVVLVIMTPIQVHFKADVPKLPDDGDSGKPDGESCFYLDEGFLTDFQVNHRKSRFRTASSGCMSYLYIFLQD